MRLRDLGGLFAEIYERSRPDLPDEDPGRAFEDRAVRLETTFQGAGVLTGDLTPECAAIVGAVLDALSAPAGADDTRTQAQRCHDALAEAMRRLLAADLVPERAGQPVKAWVHISLEDLIRMCVQLDYLRHSADAGTKDTSGGPDVGGQPGHARPGRHPGLGGHRAGDHRQSHDSFNALSVNRALTCGGRADKGAA